MLGTLPRPGVVQGCEHGTCQREPASAVNVTEAACARIQPSDVDLPTGSRRRTPGLRREEVAQLAGVGVTWYTWLEQGRPIHASVQVLDAIARTLRLDPAERSHMFRLASVPGTSDDPASCVDCPLPPEVQEILDGFAYPASVITEMFDVLAWNKGYKAIFPRITVLRNSLLAVLTDPSCCNPVENPVDHARAMVAQLRASYAGHVGDPVWTQFIKRMEAVSSDFADAWRSQDVALNPHYRKVFRHPSLGRLALTSTSFSIRAVPGARLVLYTATDPADKQVLLRLAAGEHADDRFPCWPIHDTERGLATI
jgi:transcriptional regulator with XRE-family HTH domain